ncbi:hypothetical protein OFO07_00815 [Campylobacter sp. JMF_06 NA1]|uniref:hypothetical protein n=1 Tax=Campylobacter sp. JMF_06 NA1 TaxID=2983823 RepID=UPI0022E9F8C3|nr:hypothetical protein [Campylobacter sp. JMF_06 NA1]MDA3077465.1 hypothetical protein [Campylobacter sp. JMF_06 NA1]
MFYSCSEVVENIPFTREIAKKYIVEAGIFNLAKIDLLIDCIVIGEPNFNTELFLTTDEKRNLGLNTRLKIEKELIDFFEIDKIKGLNPKDEIHKIYFRLFHYFSILRNVKKFKQMGAKKALFLCCDDERTCSFCKNNNNKKIDISDDLAEYIDKNCSCYKNKRIGGNIAFEYEYE